MNCNIDELRIPDTRLLQLVRNHGRYIPVYRYIAIFAIIIAQLVFISAIIINEIHFNYFIAIDDLAEINK